MAWTRPDSNIPKMRANPFRTEPQCLVTSPTQIPPALWVRMGIIINGVHPWKKPLEKILLPSALKAKEPRRRNMEAIPSSVLKR